jgi:hypothetical protein
MVEHEAHRVWRGVWFNAYNHSPRQQCRYLGELPGLTRPREDCDPLAAGQAQAPEGARPALSVLP